MNWLWHDIKEIENIRLPAEIPVFPLPNALLFPFIQLPLYIFEPRYRRMLADALEGDGFMAISLFKPGWESAEEPVPSHDVVGAGFLRFAQTREDGTSEIVLAGVARARIIGYIRMKPYRVARVEIIRSVVRDQAAVRKKNQALYDLFLQQLSYKTGVLDISALQRLEMLKIPEKFSDIAAFYAELDVQEKQKYLEEPDVEKRIERLIKVYESLPEE